MKLVIPTLIAAAAFTSLHASDRDEYYNSLLAKAGATPAATPVERLVVMNITIRFSQRRRPAVPTRASLPSKSAIKALSHPSMRYTLHTQIADRYFTVLPLAILVIAITS